MTWLLRVLFWIFRILAGLFYYTGISLIFLFITITLVDQISPGMLNPEIVPSIAQLWQRIVGSLLFCVPHLLLRARRRLVQGIGTATSLRDPGAKRPLVTRRSLSISGGALAVIGGLALLVAMWHAVEVLTALPGCKPQDVFIPKIPIILGFGTVGALLIQAGQALWNKAAEKETTMISISAPDGVVVQGDLAMSGNAAINTSINIEAANLAEELEQLRIAMERMAQTSEQLATADAIGSAERLARSDNGGGASAALRRAGGWALEVATQIGVPVATGVIKTALELR